jgi:hypothetical protein
MTPVSGGYASPQLIDAIAAARRATESLIQSLSGQGGQDYSYNIVLRDLDALASRLAALEPLARTGVSGERLSWEVQGVNDSADRIRTQLTSGRLAYSARLYWQSLESSLLLLRDAAGVSATLPTTMLRPTVLHQSLVPLLDVATSQIDVYLAGTTPLVYSVADVPSIQNDIRSLRNRVLVMRQQASAGEAASVLKQTLSGMVGDYQDAFDRWNRAIAYSRIANPAQLSPIGQTLNRVEQLINEALTSGQLTPAGPTRVAQDLAQLNSEVTESRRALTALAGYRQQASLDLYLEQLAGYVQQINDAMNRQRTVDARRLAVGMQGVVGHMQTEVSGLNTGVAVGPASDFSVRVGRIGRLADDIEAQLY